MLKVENLNVHYGVIHAIEDVNIEVRDGEIVTLIGANGAGKTTILHTITGLKKATSGSVVFDGTDLLKEQPSKIITHGVAHVPELYFTEATHRTSTITLENYYQRMQSRLHKCSSERGMQ